MLSRMLWFAAALLVTVGVYSACAEPPPPAAEYPLAAPPAGPGGARPILPTEQNCGLVKRAKSTWVGFGREMTMDDLVPAGIAAADVVRALDIEVCGVVQRGQSSSVLKRHTALLKAQAADGGGFEVTQVLWQDSVLAHARVELHGKGGSARAIWLALLVRDNEHWKIDSFAGR